MTPDQAEQVQKACAIISAYLRDDTDGWSILTDDLVQNSADVPKWADASFFAVVVVGNALAQWWSTDLEDALRRVTPTSVSLIPGATINWEIAIQIALSVSATSSAPPELTNQIDVPTAIQSAFSVAIAAGTQLAELTHVSAKTWFTTLATQAAREALDQG